MTRPSLLRIPDYRNQSWKCLATVRESATLRLIANLNYSYPVWSRPLLWVWESSISVKSMISYSILYRQNWQLRIWRAPPIWWNSRFTKLCGVLLVHHIKWFLLSFQELALQRRMGSRVWSNEYDRIRCRTDSPLSPPRCCGSLRKMNQQKMNHTTRDSQAKRISWKE